MNTAIARVQDHNAPQEVLPPEYTPSRETIQAFEEAKDPERVTYYETVKEAILDVWGEN